jgi:LydA holin phage, holin superfamily III
MPEKDPTSYSLLTYAWVFMLAILGGVVNFMHKLKAGHTRVFNFVEFIGELVTSAFAGVITFWLCENAGISPLMTAAFVGVSGHMGSRAIFMLENWLKEKFPA